MVNVVVAEFFMTTFWKWLLIDVLGFIQDYGWRVILLTVTIKLILSPLEFFNKKKALDNARIMEKMQPELDKLSKQFANDPAELRKRQSAIYKKYGYGAFSSCISTIVTLFIFITLIGGYAGTSEVLNQQRYEKLHQVYTTQIERTVDQQLIDQANAINNEWLDFQKAILTDAQKEGKSEEEIIKTIEKKLGFSGIEAGDNVFTLDNIQTVGPKLRQFEEVNKYIAQKLVYDSYEAQGKDSFLWIKNIWRPDTWSNPIPSQEEFYRTTKVSEDAKDDYNNVMGVIQYKYKGQWNGYLILVILSVGFNIINTFITMRQQKAKADPTNAMGSMKLMMFIMPFMIGWFALSQSSAFTLYMAVNSFMTFVLSLISTAIIKLIDKRREENESPYRRKVIK